MLGRAFRPSNRLGVSMAPWFIFVSGCLDAWPERENLAADCTQRSAEPVVGEPGRDFFVVAETDAMLEFQSIDIRGAGRREIGAIDISGGVGTIEVGCETIPMAIHHRQDGEDHRIFDGLAVKEDAVYTVELRCSYEGLLDVVEYSGTDEIPVDAEWAHGRCDEDVETVRTARVQFPSLQLRVPDRGTRVTLEGPSISVPSRGPGRIVVGGIEYQVHIFAHDFCDPCEQDFVWHDLHLMLWNAEGQRLTFAKLFFYETDARVTIRFGVTLPGFTSEFGRQELAASVFPL